MGLIPFQVTKTQNLGLAFGDSFGYGAFPISSLTESGSFIMYKI